MTELGEKDIKITCEGAAMIPVEEFEHFQGELKRLDKAQYEMLRASMVKDGFHTSIDVWKKPGDTSPRKMLDGHQRIRALRKMIDDEGYTLVGGELPVDWVIAETEKAANRIVLEKMSQYGKYDEDSIYKFMSERNLEWSDVKGFSDFPTINMGTFEKGWFDSEFNVDEAADDVPDTPKVPVTKLGDVWTLGSHTLVCGDSTLASVVATCLPSERAGLLNTDPPYGVNYDKTSGDPSNRIENDDLDGEALQAFLESMLRAALPRLTANPAFYLWHPMLTQGTFFAAAAAADILIHRQIIWVKPSLVLGHGDYHWKHELCFYGWIQGRRCEWYGSRSQTTVWNVGRENDGIHPTQKPVQLFSTPIFNHLKEGETCLDPFAGSGTQFIAAEKTGRRCGGIEIEPAYCDVILERWENYTGGAAQRIIGEQGAFPRTQSQPARSTKKK